MVIAVEKSDLVERSDMTEIHRKMTVAITGELSQPRAEVVAMLEKLSNVHFVTRVAGDTDYLIAARFDTAKARKAAVSGTTIITEEDCKKFIEAGAFPVRKHRNTHVSNWPEITWTEVYENPDLCFLKYTEQTGEISARYVIPLRRGHGQTGREYFEGFDGLSRKTFRLDRIVSIERVEE